jgi:hypothetical protein
VRVCWMSAADILGTVLCRRRIQRSRRPDISLCTHTVGLRQRHTIVAPEEVCTWGTLSAETAACRPKSSMRTGGGARPV